MRVWSTRHTGGSGTLAAALPIRSIAALGDRAFAPALFHELWQVAPIAGIAAGRLDHSGAPVAEWTYARTPAGFTDLCTGCYLPDFASSDPLHTLRSRLALTGKAGELLIGRVRANEISNSAHRSAIYDRFNLAEKLSISQHLAADETLHLTIVRRHDQPRLRTAQLDSLQHLAPTIMALLAKHRSLRAPKQGGVRDRERQLLARCPQLSRRELQLCAALLDGRTLTSIASQWNLKLSTVATYRDRAYQRLGIHFRSELFALVR